MGACLAEPQADGVFKIRKGNNGEKLIIIWHKCYGKYLRECTTDNETVTFTKTADDNDDGWPVRGGPHSSKIINMPPDTYGWYRRFTEDNGERIILKRV